MPIATYIDDTCNDCAPDTTDQPAIATHPLPSITTCPVTCQDGTITSALGLRMLPDGTPWNVNYFLQILLAGDHPAVIDPMLNPVFQRVAQINPMTLYVTSPLSNTVDTTTGVGIREGEATFIGIVVPNIGDVFLAELEDSDWYVFRVLTVTSTTATGRTNYVITYKMFSRVSDTPWATLDLSNKVADIDHYRFDSAQYLAGGNGIVSDTAEAQITASEQSAWISELQCAWRQYYDADSATYVATTAEGRLYDPYVAQLMHRTYTPSQHLLSYSASSLFGRAVSTYETSTATTLYHRLTGLCQHTVFDTPKVFNRMNLPNNLALDSIRHTTIEFMVSVSPIHTDAGRDLATFTDTTIHADGYVLSQAYLDNNALLMNPIDVLVGSALSGSPTHDVIRQALAHHQTLNVVDQYWTIPILLVVLMAGGTSL